MLSKEELINLLKEIDIKDVRVIEEKSDTSMESRHKNLQAATSL